MKLEHLINSSGDPVFAVLDWFEKTWPKTPKEKVLIEEPTPRFRKRIFQIAFAVGRFQVRLRLFHSIGHNKLYEHLVVFDPDEKIGIDKIIVEKAFEALRHDHDLSTEGLLSLKPLQEKIKGTGNASKNEILKKALEDICRQMIENPANFQSQTSSIIRWNEVPGPSVVPGSYGSGKSNR